MVIRPFASAVSSPQAIIRSPPGSETVTSRSTSPRRIAATAASYGVEICPHWFHDLHVHLVGSTPNAPFVEFFADDQVLNFRRLIDTQLTFNDGRLNLPQTPGLGFDFDEEALSRYAVEPWS